MAEKYLVQEESLISIADAVRSKAGTSDKLAFPAGFAEAIAAIEAGGGEGLSGFASGKFKLADYANEIEIVHGLGEIPIYYCICCRQVHSGLNNGNSYLMSFWFKADATYTYMGYGGYSCTVPNDGFVHTGGNLREYVSFIDPAGAGKDTTKFKLSNSYFMPSNYYVWFAMTDSAYGALS